MTHPSSGGFRSVDIYDFNRDDPHAWFAWRDLTQPVKEFPWIPRDAVYIGRCLLELAKILGAERAGRLRILVTWYWRVDPVLPHSGDDVIVFCLGDELARTPSYAHDVALVAKTGVTRRPFVVVGRPATWGAVVPSVLQEFNAQLLRVPAAVRSVSRTIRRGRPPRFVEIPLAPWSPPDGPLVPFDERRFDISFAGSMTNEGERRPILPQKTRSRGQMLAVLEELRRERKDLAVELRTFDSFHQAKHAEGYLDLMMQTRLMPCPRGGFRETYRHFEAAAAGCVPITEILPRREYYRGCPAVQLRSWSELPAAVDALMADRSSLRRRHHATLDWWQRECSPQATAARVAARLDALT
jgi:hypothetical protein